MRLHLSCGLVGEMPATRAGATWLKSANRAIGWRKICWCALVLVCALLAKPAGAVEQYEEFLKALTDQGMYDVALDYIESMRGSPLLNEAQKQQMPFDEGRLLMRAAQAERDLSAKAKLLDRARDRFNDFIKANASNPLAANAELELGNVLVERAKSLRDQANRPTNAAKKDTLVKQARELFEQAKKVFDEADQKLTAKAKSFPINLDKKKEQDKIEAREKARQDALMAHIYAAGVLYEMSKTYPPGSAEQKKLLQQAADKHGATYEKHRKKVAGFFARLSQAQCYQELGDYKKALGMYEDVLNLPDDEEAFRRLKASALPLAMQCWTSDKEKNYERAAERGEEWLGRANAAVERSPEGLAIRYYTALADKLLADSLTKKEDEPRKKEALAAARKHAQFVSKNPGDYRDEAKQLYQKLPGGESAGEPKEPTTFAEARDQAKDALDLSQDKLAAIKMAPTMNDQENVPKYQAEADRLRGKAAKLFKRALELRNAETSLDDVNAVRYYLAFLDFQAGNYYEAAVLGEFIAKHYSSNPIARQSAKIAMLAYTQAYSKPLVEKKDKQFDKQKMIELAELITRAWPGQEEADDAWTILIDLAVQGQQPKLAAEYLAKIPDDSPRRATAELKLGRSLWAGYLQAGRQDDAQRPPQAELDQMAATSRKMLEDGAKRIRAAVESGGSDVTQEMALAMFSLAQIDLESGQATQALELLNDPKIGPLTLAAARHAATQFPGKFNYAVEAYKLALRAYVATEALDKAEQTMDGLEKLVGESGDADAASQLTRIYIALGRELEAQVQRLRQENKTDELKKVSQGFQLFLQRISQREKGNTFNSLNWVAATFYSLGTGYDDPSAKDVPAEAKTYYDKSLEIDKKILGQIQQDPAFAPQGAQPVVRLRMAKTERALRNFEGAIELLKELLKAHANMIDAQIEAATTYQEWGAQETKRYLEAMGGAVNFKTKSGREDKLLWGWARIAIRTQPLKDSRMQDYFYLARYHLAKCRMEYAKQKSGKDKTNGLQKAETDILFTHQIRPTLGGPDWQKKFDDLLKQIQRLLGKKPTGLPAEMAKPKKGTKAEPVSAKKSGE